MPPCLTLWLPSCLLPAAESVTNFAFKKLQTGAVLFFNFYFIFLFLLQNAAVIQLQGTSVLHHAFLIGHQLKVTS